MPFRFDERGILRYRPWAERRWLVHGFSSRATGDFRGRSAHESAVLLGLSGPLVTLRQTHSARVRRCISAARFEVGPEVAERFAGAAVVRAPGRPKPHVDLPAAVRLQLVDAGLDPERVLAARQCSYSEPERFHSYRRDGDAFGRMIAFVGLVSEG